MQAPNQEDCVFVCILLCVYVCNTFKLLRRVCAPVFYYFQL